MKRLLVLLCVCGFLPLLFSGCQDKVSKETTKVAPSAKNNSPVFPLAGTWLSENWNWELVIDPNGTLTSVMIPLGEVRVKPNSVTKVQGWKEEPGVYEAGDCKFAYEPASRQITVSVKMKRIYIKFGNSLLDGTCEYYLAGESSPDNSILYLTEVSVLNLNVLEADPNSPPDKPVLHKVGILDTDPNDPESISQQVIFKKVQPKK